MLRVFVSRRRADQTLRLRRRYPEILRGRIQIISYEGARWRLGLPGGAFLFTNLEELDSRLFERARLIAAAIHASDPDAVIFNDPRTVLRRYELVGPSTTERTTRYVAYEFCPRRSFSRASGQSLLETAGCPTHHVQYFEIGR